MQQKHPRVSSFFFFLFVSLSGLFFLRPLYLVCNGKIITLVFQRFFSPLVIYTVLFSLPYLPPAPLCRCELSFFISHSFMPSTLNDILIFALVFLSNRPKWFHIRCFQQSFLRYAGSCFRSLCHYQSDCLSCLIFQIVPLRDPAALFTLEICCRISS